MKNKPEEYILCAAIWYKDMQPQFYQDKADVLKMILPFNCEKGMVFCGWRHANCLYQMVLMTGLYQHQAGEEVQGFLTNKNRFVDRKEGLAIAQNAQQVITNQDAQLYSEDLY